LPSRSAIRTTLLVLAIGIPPLLILTVLTEGAILLPLEGLAVLAPFVAVNYLLWGRRASRDRQEGDQPPPVQ
jgi:hypothetical protein